MTSGSTGLAASLALAAAPSLAGAIDSKLMLGMRGLTKDGCAWDDGMEGCCTGCVRGGSFAADLRSAASMLLNVKLSSVLMACWRVPLWAAPVLLGFNSDLRPEPAPLGWPGAGSDAEGPDNKPVPKLGSAAAGAALVDAVLLLAGLSCAAGLLASLGSTAAAGKCLMAMSMNSPAVHESRPEAAHKQRAAHSWSECCNPRHIGRSWAAFHSFMHHAWH